MIILLLLFCFNVYGLDKNEYQHKIIEETRIFRNQEFYVSYNSDKESNYMGPWIEDRFFDYFVNKNLQKTTNAIYLPISWTGSEIINRIEWKNMNNWALEYYLNNLKTNFSYFTLIQIAKGFENDAKLHINLPKNLNLTVFATGYTSGTRLIPIPLLKEILKPKGLNKENIVSFTGSFTIHPIRKKMKEIWGTKWLLKEHDTNWKIDIEKSFYVLCPRGWGMTSFRLFETLQLGSIPIYIYDDAGPWLPYQEILDWDKLAIIISDKNLSDIETILMQKNTTAMIQYGKKFRHLWTYDGILNYLEKQITKL